MNPEVMARFLADSQGLEGMTTWLYLDVRGYVTVGMGNLVDPVGLLWLAKLDWRWGLEPTAREATDEEIWSVWSKTKAYQSWRVLGGGHAKWQNLSPLRATEPSLEELIASKAERFYAALTSYFPQMAAWPSAAQEALMLMAWAMGPAFPPGWPHLSDALRNRDFVAAAANCHMNEAGQNSSFHRRNEMVVARFLEAATDPANNCDDAT